MIDGVGDRSQKTIRRTSTAHNLRWCLLRQPIEFQSGQRRLFQLKDYIETVPSCGGWEIVVSPARAHTPQHSSQSKPLSQQRDRWWGNINVFNATPERRKDRALRVKCTMAQFVFWFNWGAIPLPNIQTQHLLSMTEASWGPPLDLLVRPLPWPIFGSLWPALEWTAAPLDHLHQDDYSALRRSTPSGCWHFLLACIWACLDSCLWACLDSSLCSSLVPLWLCPALPLIPPGGPLGPFGPPIWSCNSSIGMLATN